MATKSKKSTPLYFGGIASCMAAFCTHPLDLIKVRLQTRKLAPGEAKPGMLLTGFQIVRQEGLRHLYDGLSASLLRQATYSTVRFGAYDWMKSRFQIDESGSLWFKVLLGMAAGAAGGFCGSPADITNIRMQADGRLPPDQRRNYKHALDGLMRIAKDEGVLTLWRGVGANINRAMLMTASQVATYDHFKAFLLRTGLFSDNLLTHFNASFLAGLVATTVCSPIDVVKTRIMNDSTKEYKSAFDCATKVYRSEGVMAFFRGWVPSYVRLGPQTVLTFIFLEQIKHFYNAQFS